MSQNKETNLHRNIMIALSEAGCMVFRNEVGVGWVGRELYRDGQTVTITQSQRISFGLRRGSSDIIGIAPGGRFLAVEVKVPKSKSRRAGVLSEDQDRFRANIERAGGIALVAHSPKEAVDLLRSALASRSQ